LPISRKARTVLREMEMGAYEIDTYVTLLGGGRMTAMEVSKEAKVPYSKIYEVLNSLKDKGWIESTFARPFKYYPTSPLEAVALARLKLEDRCKSWEQAAIEELQPLYEKRELVERPDVIILHGQKAVLSKLEEILKKAAKEVMIAAPEFVRGLITSSEFPLNVLENAVEIRLMVAGKAEDWLFLKGFSKIDELRVRDNMFGGGVIADSKEAMLFLGEEQPNLVIWSNHLGLVRFAREYFQFLWDTSAPV